MSKVPTFNRDVLYLYSYTRHVGRYLVHQHWPCPLLKGHDWPPAGNGSIHFKLTVGIH